MNRRYLFFIAMAISMCFGLGFAVGRGNLPDWYAVVGGVISALAWLSIGVFGKAPSRDANSPQQPGN